MNRKFNPFMKTIITWSIIALILSGCQAGLTSGKSPVTSHSFPKPPKPKPEPMAEIFFAVTIPAPLQTGETLVLSILDEVTGLSINPENHLLQKGDNTHYYLAIPFALNSVVKYRYIRQGENAILESRYDNSSVRYRLFYVGGPGEVMDTVTSWTDTSFSGETGRITGKVVNNDDESGLSDILVSVGGNQTLSDSNGDFVLEGLVAGTHNLVTYSLDGKYQPFQQGATIIPGKRTPVVIKMNPVPLVNVVFTVIVPDNTVPSAPIRFAGNLIQLGNSFGDLDGGLSSVAVDMPVLTPLLDGRFSISLMLPVGADIRYKYTMGDGFWNAEHESSGSFTTRQIIVPSSGGAIQDYVETWQAGPAAPILFEVKAPDNTPPTDIVSIQFNPYGWTEPIQMWPLGNNQWVYQLFSPFNLLSSFEYRYCRNDQCGSADEIATSGNSKGREVVTSLKPQDLKDAISSWNWFSDNKNEIDLKDTVQPGIAGFLAGVELAASYSPVWRPWMPLAFQDIQAMGSNLVVVSPTWTYQKQNPLVFGPVLGEDPIGVDVSMDINTAHALKLNVALFPQVNFQQPVDDWWTTSPRDAVWWDAWFARYRSFAIYYADLAKNNNAQMLVLGGDWMGPAQPAGVLADGTGSNLPMDSETRWSSLIAEIRQHFNGQIYWAIPYQGIEVSLPVFMDALDGIYLLWYAPLATTDQGSTSDMQAEAERLLDTQVFLMQKTYQKPLIISIAYPSISGTAKACISTGGPGCMRWSSLNQPNSRNNSLEINMKAQEEVYLSVLKAVNLRNWITGFVSRGYFPPANLQDASASIHGKLTSSLLQYWYPRFLGSIK